MFIELICFIVGIAVGVISVILACNKKAVGELLVNTTDPDGPYLFLKLKGNPNEFIDQRYITLVVNIKKNSARK